MEQEAEPSLAHAEALLRPCLQRVSYAHAVPAIPALTINVRAYRAHGRADAAGVPP